MADGKQRKEDVLDLFDAPEDSPAPDTNRGTGASRELGEQLLAAVIATSSRKAALKALEPFERKRLEGALLTFASNRQAAYSEAQQGILAQPNGWLVRKPELADAVSVLNAHFVSEVPLLLHDGCSLA